MIVYLATNRTNGKQYVGLTTLSLSARKLIHRHDSIYKDYPFQRAIRKYGIDGFDWTTLRECMSEKEMTKWEKHFIQKFNTYGNGYNAHPGGAFRTKEQRLASGESLSKRLMGHKLSEETKRKIGDTNRNKVRSKKFRQHMSRVLKGRPAWNRGLKMDDEWKKVRSTSGIGKKKPGTSIAMKKKWAKYRKLHGEK